MKKERLQLSRRNFIRLSILTVGGSVLTACGLKNGTGSATSPTTVPLPTATAQSLSAATSQPFSTSAPVTSNGPLPAGILGRPTDRTITANLLSSQDADVYFEYGTASGAYVAKTTAVPARSGVPVNLLLDNLQPNTRYYYRIRSQSAGASEFSASEERCFVAQRLPGESFVFTVDADPHNKDPNFNGELYDITLNNAVRDQPDFHINLGDTFMTEKLNITTLDGVIGTYTDMRSHLSIIGAQTPLFLVNGNHEGELGWFLNNSDQNLAVWCSKTRQAYFPNPTPDGFYSGSSVQEQFIGIRDSYYAWNWGDVLLVVLDPFWYTRSKPKPQPNGNWGWTLGKAQYDWFKETLETSQAKYKFVFIHNLVGGNDSDARGGIEAAPYYEWGGKNADGSEGFAAQRPSWGVPIHQLLVQNHVSALFHGHDHVFVHQELDGVVYQEFPQPSITHYNNIGLAQQYGYTHGDVVSSSGHLRVKVTPEQATVEYVRAYLPKDEGSGQQNGQVAYAYTIPI